MCQEKPKLTPKQKKREKRRDELIDRLIKDGKEGFLKHCIPKKDLGLPESNGDYNMGYATPTPAKVKEKLKPTLDGKDYKNMVAWPLKKTFCLAVDKGETTVILDKPQEALELAKMLTDWAETQ